MIIPSTAESYRAEWATLTGKSEREIYIPVALREEPAVLAWCSWCGDEYAPVEYASVPVDPDEPRFCSDLCESAYTESVEMDQVYAESRYGGAPVFP